MYLKSASFLIMSQEISKVSGDVELQVSFIKDFEFLVVLADVCEVPGSFKALTPDNNPYVTRLSLVPIKTFPLAAIGAAKWANGGTVSLPFGACLVADSIFSWSGSSTASLAHSSS